MFAFKATTVARICAQNARNLQHKSSSIGRLLQLLQTPVLSLTRMITTHNSSSITSPATASLESSSAETRKKQVVFLDGPQLVNQRETLTGSFVDGKLQGTGLLSYLDNAGAIVFSLEVEGRDGGLFPVDKTLETVNKINYAAKPNQFEFLTQGNDYQTLLQRAVFNGEYADGKYHKGTLTFNEHLSVTGEFRDNRIYSGSGAVLQPNGVVYVGSVVRGKFEGYGVLHFKEGNAVQGVFSDGARVNTHCVSTSKHGVVTLRTYKDGALQKNEDKLTHTHTGSSDSILPSTESESDAIQHGGGLHKEAHYTGTGYSGEMHGEGAVTASDGSRYEGMLAHGKFHGQGQHAHSAGLSVVGEFRKGWLYNGSGSVVSHNGNVFSGSWVEGKKHGQGKRTFADGNVVEGEFKDDKLWNGSGSIVLPNGYKYAGTWMEGEFHGQGKLTYSDGNVVEGEFRQGQLWNGCGSMARADGIKFSGSWVEGKKHGQGKFTFADGNVLEGEFKDNLLWNGTGVQPLPNGSVFGGTWVEGKWSGEGMLLHANGKVQKGTIVNGKLQVRKVKAITTSPVTIPTHASAAATASSSPKLAPGVAFTAADTSDSANDGTVQKNKRKKRGKQQTVKDEHSVVKAETVLLSGTKRSTVTMTSAVPLHQTPIHGATLFRAGSASQPDNEATRSETDLVANAPATPTLTSNTAEGKAAPVQRPAIASNYTLQLPNGAVYVGQHKNKLMHGSGTITYADSTTLTGEFKKGKIHDGSGTYVYDNGTVSRGTWKNGELHGEGVVVSSDGCRYDGMLAHGKYHGQGLLLFADGHWVEGEFSKGELWNGTGRMNLPDGDVFSGTWVSGKPQEEETAKSQAAVTVSTDVPTYSAPTPGLVTYPDGSVYEGAMVGDSKEGLGTLTYPDGRSHFGLFKHDVLFHGEGCVVLPDGSVYDGAIQEAIQHGEGKLTFKDGKVYEGQFKRGVRTVGRMTYTNGQVFEGTFCQRGLLEQGRLISRTGDVWVGTFADGLPHTGSGVLTSAEGVVRTGKFVAGSLEGEGSTVYAYGGSKRGVFVKGQLRDGVRVEVQRDGRVTEMRVVNGALTSVATTVHSANLQNTEKNVKNPEPEPVADIQHDTPWFFSSDSGSEHPAVPTGAYTLLPVVHTVPYKVKHMDGIQGTIEYTDGSSYSGGWFEGMMHGKGALIYKNLKCLVGEFKDGRIHDGAGSCVLEGGGAYEGLFKEGRVHGKGVYIDEGGFLFEGEVISSEGD